LQAKEMKDLADQIEHLNHKMVGLSEENSSLHTRCGEMEELEVDKARTSCRLAQV
jgi:peroxiredoxin